MKRTKLFLIVTIACLTFFSHHASFSQNDLTVAIVKSGEFSQYQTAITGFLSGLRGAGKSPNLEYFTLAKNYRDTEISSQINAKSPDLILAVGTEAAQLCARRIKNTPVVFCMVLDPVENNLTNVSNITGVSLNIPLEYHLQTMADIVPGLTDIGILYNPQHNQKNITEAKTAANTLGINLIAEKVYSREDITRGFTRMVDSIDFMWILPDPTVSNAYTIKYLLTNTMKKSIPVMGISKNYVKAGALVALVPDYYDIGKQASEMAAKITDEGASPGTLAIAAPRKHTVVLNLKTASVIRLDIPASIKNNAEKFK